MKKSLIAKLGAVACILAFALALAGCASPASNASPEQKANRAYMSQVNETMVELDDQLDQFVDAVSRGDVVNMRTQADNAYKTLDKLADIEPPDGLADIHDGYVKGADKLRQALDEYIDLYTEAASADESYDWNAYDRRITKIQKLYDEGVKILSDTDELAAES